MVVCGGFRSVWVGGLWIGLGRLWVVGKLWWVCSCRVMLSHGGHETVVGLGGHGLWDVGCVGLGFSGSFGGGVWLVW